MNDEKPTVEAKIKIIPERRSASYSIPVGGDGGVSHVRAIVATVNAKTITFAGLSDIPKTLEAADAILALAEAVRAELITQGISE